MAGWDWFFGGDGKGAQKCQPDITECNAGMTCGARGPALRNIRAPGSSA